MQFDKKEINYDEIEKIAHQKAIDPSLTVPNQRISRCVTWVSRFNPLYSELAKEAREFYQYILRKYYE